MKRALLKIAHDMTRLVVWFVLSGLCSVGIMAVWRDQFAPASEAAAAAFVVCMVIGCGLAVLTFFLSKRVASALIPIHPKTTRRLT